MRYLSAWLMVLAAVHGCLADGELFCGCRIAHRRDASLSLHCSRNQEKRAGFSCQKATVPEITPGYQFLTGYALVKLYRTAMPWSGAKATCEADGSRLAIPPDRYAMDGLKQIFAQEQGIWWALLGITDEANEGVFVGVDGRPAPYLKWEANEPNNHAGKENCVTVRDNGFMNDLSCERVSPFFCERLLSVGVPDTYRWLTEAGRFYKVHKEQLSHEQAAHTCRSENATLAVTDTWRRGEIVLTLFGGGGDAYHIGFTDQVTEGDFVTETGRHLNDMEFRVWGVGEPNNSELNQEEDCLALSAAGFYNDVRCDRELPFICEIVPK